MIKSRLTSKAQTTIPQAVRAALIEGEESGAPQPFDVQAFKARMAAAVHG